MGALLVMLGGGGMALFHSADRGTGMAVWGMIGAVIVIGGLWLLRLLYYRVSAHNARLYDQLVEQQRQEWWKQHQQHFSLSEVVLLGPVGTDIGHWLRLLRREHRLPEVKYEASGKALRTARTMQGTADEREVQLAKMLALQWQAQRVKSSLPLLKQCYWQGSLLSWQAFCEQVQATFPDFALPDVPLAWRGEASLSALAAESSALTADSAILVAGCQSLTASFSDVQPAGESAALWLVRKEGPVCLARGEFYNINEQGSLSDVSKRALKQSNIDDAPETCILFSQPELPELAQSGWNVVHHIQDLNWGNPGEMEMLITLSLAALYAHHYQEPCGWIAKDTLHTLALGIVKPYGEGK